MCEVCDEALNRPLRKVLTGGRRIAGGGEVRNLTSRIWFNERAAYCFGARPSFTSAFAMISRVRSIMSGLTLTLVMPHSTSFSVTSG